MYDGQGRGWRRRNMYRLTGLPGWMRFGYSPGWMGRSPTGLPPTAQYLMQTRQMPQPYPGQVPPMQLSAIQAPSMEAFTHEDCVNFRDGFCTLKSVMVDPNGVSCPDFMPRSVQAPWGGWGPFAGTSGIPPAPMPQSPAGFPPAQMPQMPREQEIQMLEGQARMVEQQLEQIKRRLEELRR